MAKSDERDEAHKPDDPCEVAVVDRDKVIIEERDRRPGPDVEIRKEERRPGVEVEVGR
jgi:hypothetical protein